MAVLKITRILATLIVAIGLSAMGPPQPAEIDRDQTPTLIAFGSCANKELPQLIWDSVLSTNPDLFIFMMTMSMQT
jgi:hypothetical protein